MFQNFFKTAFRNLFKNRSHSFINITGLAVGMAVAMLIGLWIWDELSFNKYHQNYQRIAQVMQNRTINGQVRTGSAIPLPLDAEMRRNYSSDFKHIVMASFTEKHILSTGDKQVTHRGNFMGAEAPEMLTLHMLKGSRNGLQGPSSMLISQSVAGALFGTHDPMGKLIKLDNKAIFSVSGVYEDLPGNTTFGNLAFIAPWDFFAATSNWIGRSPTDWGDNSLFMYVQIADQAVMQKVSEKIKNIIRTHGSEAETKHRPRLFLQPMSKWHLYSKFENGVNTGGAVQYIWLFGTIGLFVLVLACINFMNLSTARSEKRAREVGVRKAVGSLRSQLIGQFFCESWLMATLASGLSLALVWFTLPYFNTLAGKDISMPWNRPLFWIMCAGFTLFTTLVSGSYPAFYLSAFKPVKVLKGTFKAGALAALPRKVLVVMQFSISTVLIIGTIIVFKQIQFAKDRPVGYSRDGLVYIETVTDDLHNHFDAVRADLLKSGHILEIAESTSPATGINNNRTDIEWKGKDPSMTTDFGSISVTPEYGKTVGWQFVAGRDFSRQFATDSSSIILNEAAVQYMNLSAPAGETIKVGKKYYTVIGVVKNMVMGSPYQPAKQSVFRITGNQTDYLNIRINPAVSAHTAIATLAAIHKRYSPAVPFTCKFADDEYAAKFRSEERIGRLAGVFATLAIFISCLGLFGMASFMAEQRTKEIGVRKVMGASVFNLWRLLSKEFVALVVISLFVAIPVAWYAMHNWLQQYEYRSGIPWWIFAATGIGALLITILTVSYQTIKAALSNPVKSLRSE